jgi:hypothetical protein
MITIYICYLKARLHCSENRSKLVHFKEQKKCFALLKHPSLERFSPKCRDRFSQSEIEITAVFFEAVVETDPAVVLACRVDLHNTQSYSFMFLFADQGSLFDFMFNCCLLNIYSKQCNKRFLN